MPDHVIEVREPGAATRRVLVSGSWDVGREGVDLRVDDDQVSRHHLRISVRDDELAVEDLGTTNGTRVNGERIDGAVVVRPGDVIGIGRTEIELVRPALAPPQLPTTTRVPAAAAPSRPTLDDLDARDVGAAIIRFRRGSAGERALDAVVAAVRRARKRLEGFGSEPWGTKPQIVLVDPFADPDQPGHVITSGTIVDVLSGQIWMVVSPESPPEDPERSLALLFGSAFPAAAELQFLLEGYGLVLAETPDPDPTLREIGRPPLAAAEGQLAGAMARSFVAYLIDRDGRVALLRFLASAQAGQVDQAAREVFGAGLASLEEQWSRKLDAGAPTVRAGQFLRLTTRYLRPHVRRQIEIFLYMLLGLGFTMVFPFAFKRLLDEAIPSGELGEVMSILGVLAIFFAISLVADLRRGYVSAYVGSSIVRRVRTEMFGRLQQLTSRWFAQRQQGEILSRLFSDVGQMEAGVSQALREGLFQLLSLVVSSIVLLTLDPLLGVIVIAAAPVVAIVYKLMSKGAQKRSIALQEELGSVFEVAGENYSGQPVVKAFALESRENTRFQQASDRLFTRQLRLQLFGGLFGLAVNGIVTLLRLVVLGLGSWMILEGDLTVGTLVAFMSIMGQVISPVTTLTSLGQEIQAATGSLIRINEVLEAVPDIAEDPHAPSLPPLSREIRLTGVGFSYTPERRTLDGVDCVIRAGQRVAFVGPTGAGKSSVLQLLQRFYDVDEGAVLFDGQDIRTVKLSSLRGQLGVVFQESFLFDTTIRDNIAMGRPGATDEAIEAAARAAELHDSIMAMPRGYSTTVGERGGRLSGGQRQRLAIARALLRDPRVLLLDEATSALDPRTERMISATLERVGEGRTTISVTHRLTSITAYDRIFVIVAGRLVEQGTHPELLAMNGVYAELWAEQVGGRVVTEAPFDLAGALAALPLFAGLSRQELAPVVERVTALDLRAGETVPEGGGRVAIIRRGRGRVLVPGLTGEPQESAVLGPGDAFGLAALLGEESGAVLEAVEPTKLVVLDDATVTSLAAMHPSVAAALTGNGRARSAAPAGAIRLSRVTLGPGTRAAPLSAVTDAAREARRASGTFSAVRP